MKAKVKKHKERVKKHIKKGYDILHNLRFVHFLLIGASGFLINLVITYILTEFIFGKENYFYAYIIGIVANMVYNFILHTKITFQTKDRHVNRFFTYATHYVLITAVNLFSVKAIVAWLGLKYYLLIIISVTAIIFLINFVISKLFIFKKQ